MPCIRRRLEELLGLRRVRQQVDRSWALLQGHGGEKPRRPLAATRQPRRSKAWKKQLMRPPDPTGACPR